MSKKEQSSSLKSFIKDVDKYNSKAFRESEQKLRQREETDRRLEAYRKKENKRNAISKLIVTLITLVAAIGLAIVAKTFSENINKVEEQRLNLVSELTEIIVKDSIIENDEDLQNWISTSSTGEIGLIHSTIESTDSIYIGDEQYSKVDKINKNFNYKCLGLTIESELVNLNEVSKAYKIEQNGETYKVLPLQFMTYIVIEKTENNSCKVLQLIDDIYSFTGLSKEQVVGDIVGIAITETDEGVAVNLVKDYNNTTSENISESENTNIENIENINNSEELQGNYSVAENFKITSDEFTAAMVRPVGGEKIFAIILMVGLVLLLASWIINLCSW